MICPACQSPAADQAKFCGECGASLRAPVASAPTAALPPVPAQPAPTPAVAESPDAQFKVSRRQMTVLFCDLVGSTAMATKLAPEDMMEALQSYLDIVKSVAAQFGGFVARVVGDGVDLYFGYPMASEDDAARAIHAGLAIVAELGRLGASGAAALQVRIGIATGMVAVGRFDTLSIAGSTPNLAARIQAATAPGTVAIAPVTRRIAGGQFDCTDLGAFELKGFDEPVHIHAVSRAISMASRSAWRGRDTSTAMIGRDGELATLMRCWGLVTAAATRGALIKAEAGFGKSRLVTAFDQALPAQGHTTIRLQCSPYQTNSALQPFVAHLALAAGFSRHDSVASQIEKLEAQLAIAGVEQEQDISLLAALLGIDSGERYAPIALPPPVQLQLTKEALQHYFAGLSGARSAVAGQRALSSYFVGLAEHRPLLLVIEDLHWIDPTSLELIQLILASGDSAQILVLMTTRPEFADQRIAAGNVDILALTRLDNAAATAMATQLATEMKLGADAIATIIAKTDGVPLYIEELTRMVIDSRAAGDVGAISVPDTLIDLLTERLDRLGPAKWLAQVAAVIGREFERDLLFAAAEMDAAALDAALARMLGSGLVLPSGLGGDHFIFKHALVEDTAYGSIPNKRCTALHGRVADALLADFPQRVERQPELAARHLSRADRALPASGYWLRAGAQALGRGAPREAAAHLKDGVAVLAAVADSVERAESELALLSMLGPTTMVLMGPGAAPFGDVQKRAHALCHSLPGAPRQFPITYGLCLYHWGRAELRVASELAGQLLAAARARPTETEPAMAANNMSGMIRFHRGDAVAARAHLEESVGHYQPQRDAALYPVYLMDFGVFGRFYLALATFVSGDADRARQHARDAFELAGGLNQPHTLGFSMLANFVIAVLGDDAVTARQFAEQCIAFSSQLGFPEFIAMARVARGWATAREGQLEAGLADLDAGIAGWQATGFENWQSWFAVLRCEILAALGRHDDALAEVERQFERIEVNGEDQFRSLLLAEKASLGFALQRNAEAAVADFDRAAELAHRQGAVAWGQRIAQRRAAALAEVAA